MNEKIITSVSSFNSQLEEAFNMGYSVGTLIEKGRKQGKIKVETKSKEAINKPNIKIYSSNGLAVMNEKDYLEIMRMAYRIGISSVANQG